MSLILQNIITFLPHAYAIFAQPTYSARTLFRKGTYGRILEAGEEPNNNAFRGRGRFRL